MHNEPDREERAAEALKSHVSDAFRGGKIKSIISVFAPRTPGQPDRVRMANHQLIRYAGFEGAGDPDSRAISAHFLQVGWKPEKQDAFTLLPWQFYWDEWPATPTMCSRNNLIWPKEVLLEHPDHAAFVELGLKWYALPVLAAGIKIGGIVYPFAPFNGYYMGTEIGARNLADADRYNQLPAVAECFGLDTSNERTLWRDRALVELNRAVLYRLRQSGHFSRRPPQPRCAI